MNNVFYLLIIVSLLPFIFLYFLLRRFSLLLKRKGDILPLEENLTPLYTLNCGGLFDSYNVTFPFVRVSFYKDFFVISFINKILLRYSEVQQVEVQNFLLFQGLQIKHTKENIPKKIVLWVTDGKKLKDFVEKKII